MVTKSFLLVTPFFLANQDPSARLHELKIRLKRLPDCNIDTLQYLIQHLRRYSPYYSYVCLPSAVMTRLSNSKNMTPI